MKWSALVAATALLAGCATTPPPPPTPSLQEVRANPQGYLGEEVRWGGLIAEVANRERETCVTVVGRQLESSGRPRDTDASQGRFIACVDGFLDPMVYQPGREFTVSGMVTGSESQRIGDFPYRYPVVKAVRHQLWEPEPDYYVVEPDPFWYDPWYWGPGWGPYWGPHSYYPYPLRAAPRQWRDPRRH